MIDHGDGYGEKNDQLNGEHRQDRWPIDGVIFWVEVLGFRHRCLPFRVSAVLAVPLVLRCELIHTVRNSSLGRAPNYCLSMLTIAVPLLIMSSSTAAARLKSMMRPRPYGPRSTILTTTALPFRTFVTRTRVPNGKVR